MPIIVTQHSDANRPGRLGRILRDHTFKLRVIRLDKGEPLPPDLDDVEGVISLGGPQSVNEPHAWIPRELDFIRAAHEKHLPVVGVCLGHQLIAKALGGEVGPMEPATPGGPAGEIGFTDVEVLPTGHTDTILNGIAWKHPQFQKHKDEVKATPPNAVVLMKSHTCPVHAFRAGMRTYGFQFHFEADHGIINDLLADATTELHAHGITTAEFNQHLEQHYDMFQRLSERLCASIANYLIPRVATAIRV